MSAKTQDVKPIIVPNGGNAEPVTTATADGGLASNLIGNQIHERAFLAEGTQRPPMEMIERYLKQMDEFGQTLQRRIEQNAQQQLVKVGNGGYAPRQTTSPQSTSGSSVELTDPTTDTIYGVPYKWWDVFAIGPVQGLFATSYVKPHKIFAGGEVAFFFLYVATNPLGINYGPPPSATTVMAGKHYRLRLETLNLTNVTPGPVISIPSIFPGDPNWLQSYLVGFSIPNPLEGRPEIIEVNVTADVVGWHQPMAAFASAIYDVDRDPGFPLGLAHSPHFHDDIPLRCLCYRK